MNIDLDHSAGRSRIRGLFYLIVRMAHVGQVLDGTHSSAAGRYHASGQRALYMSPTPDWAAIALSASLSDGHPRVIVPLDVDWAEVVDLRDLTACAAAGVTPQDADASWAEGGDERPSWTLADRVRNTGCDGLIDPSKLSFFSGAWHLVLFAWNQPGRPGSGPEEIPSSASFGEVG